MSHSAAASRAGRIVTLMGEPLALVGEERGPGDRAPDFTAVGPDLRPVSLADLRAEAAGGVLVLSSVPSIDTGVCARETRRLDREAARLGDAVRIVTVSMDLPFALERWRDEVRLERMRLVSDHREAQFGQRYGVLLPALRLLARVVFVIDAAGVIRHVERVSEQAHEPDYDRIVASVDSAARAPSVASA